MIAVAQPNVIVVSEPNDDGSEPNGSGVGA